MSGRRYISRNQRVPVVLADNDVDESMPLGMAVTMLGGDGLVAVIQSFFDESYEDDGSLMLVAGYVFTTRKLREFERNWRAMYLAKKLPFMHMVELAHLKTEHFDKLSRQESDLIGRKAISLIKKYASYGFVIHVDPRSFEKDWHTNFVRNAYETCIWYAMGGVKLWKDRYAPGAKLSYFFEKGFKNQGLTDTAIRNLFRDPEMIEIYGNPSHAFVPKEDSPGAQAADMLCWLSLQELRRQAKTPNKRRRRDCVALATAVETYICPVDVKLWNDSVITAARRRVTG